MPPAPQPMLRFNAASGSYKYINAAGVDAERARVWETFASDLMGLIEEHLDELVENDTVKADKKLLSAVVKMRKDTEECYKKNIQSQGLEGGGDSHTTGQDT